MIAAVISSMVPGRVNKTAPPISDLMRNNHEDGDRRRECCRHQLCRRGQRFGRAEQFRGTNGIVYNDGLHDILMWTPNVPGTSMPAHDGIR